ncbi:FHA domain-containing protein [Aeoliella sp. SH292]|uniref:FHA domain-containing protein n=1 Tax=Aeoliella sp. SH292 TaxID=3454464 RepID=UPI003F9DE171
MARFAISFALPLRIAAMAHISLYVLDGADRGRKYESLVTPITIGREEGNAVQLNDERISRFHIKIQEDQDMLVLTDLDSTNGTRVNGEQVQLRILRYGDVISLGRSVLRYGTREQIAQRLKSLRESGEIPTDQLDASALAKHLELSPSDPDVDWGSTTQSRSTLHIPRPPELPEGLGPAQSAQLSELLEYLHLRTRALLEGVEIPEESRVVEIDIARWQEVLDMQGLLAGYLRNIGEPEKE